MRAHTAVILTCCPQYCFLFSCCFVQAVDNYFLNTTLKETLQPKNFSLIFFVDTARYKMDFPQGEKEKSFGAIIAAQHWFQFEARCACTHALAETRLLIEGD